MKIFISLILLSIFITAFSCNSHKKTMEQKEQNGNLDQNMIDNGYSSGKIIGDESSDCKYTIDLDDVHYTYLLDPINLEDEFKKDGLMVWVKFSALRMQNRCENANPVNIAEIKIKES